MKQSIPLVSIITPVYNALPFLEETILSVLNQSYKNWEWLLVNDCSTDGSWELLNSYARIDSRFKLIENQKNIGQGKSRNKAIQQAKGKFIAFLDADDLWSSSKLQLQVEFMLEKNIVFSHTSYGYIDSQSKIIKKTFIVTEGFVKYKDLLKRTEISCLTAIYDAEKIGKFYMTEGRTKEDYGLWLDILRSGVSSYGINQELAYYRQHERSTTSKKHKLIVNHYRFLREHQKLSIFNSIKYTCFWIFNGIIRYYL